MWKSWRKRPPGARSTRHSTITARSAPFIDEGIKQQSEFNVEAFEAASGRILSQAERAQMIEAVTRGMRWIYLGTAMTHPNFLATVEQIKPGARARIEALAPDFC